VNELNTFQKYLVEEFYDDYREGLISRRSFVRRVAYITGGMAAAVSTMSILGCTPAELPAPTEPIPSPDPTARAALQPTQAAAPSAQAGELQPVPGA
jgi:carboxymethylenebutenolidase